MEEAKLLAEGGKEAFRKIKENIDSNIIDCAYKQCNACIFSVNENQYGELDTMLNASNQAAVSMQYVVDNPFPIAYHKVAEITNNAQFNPVLYIYGLLAEYQKLGGQLIEKCRVPGMGEGETIRVELHRENAMP